MSAHTPRRVPRQRPLPPGDRDAQTVRLLYDAGHSDEPEHTRLIDEAVELNMGLADSVARRYRYRGIDLDDLTQVAYLGLVNAVHRFDPDRGKGFATYAVPTITGEIKRYFRDHGWAVRPPRRIQELNSQVSTATAEIAQREGHTATTDEVAGILHADANDVREAVASNACFRVASLDYQGPHGEYPPMAHILGDNEDGYGRSEAIVALGPACRNLNERDRRVIALRFYHGWTQQQIATEIGVSQMQVSRLLARILRDLRRAIETGDDHPMSTAGARSAP